MVSKRRCDAEPNAKRRWIAISCHETYSRFLLSIVKFFSAIHNKEVMLFQASTTTMLPTSGIYYWQRRTPLKKGMKGLLSMLDCKERSWLCPAPVQKKKGFLVELSLLRSRHLSAKLVPARQIEEWSGQRNGASVEATGEEI